MTAFSALSTLRPKLQAEHEDLAAELIERLDWFRIDRLTTQAVADEASAWLRVRLNALAEVRADELRKPRLERDREWLDGATDVLDLATTLLLQVGRKRQALRRAA